MILQSTRSRTILTALQEEVVRRLFPALLMTLTLLFPLIGFADPPRGPEVPDEICGARIVFLGESSHGAGTSISTKAALAEELLQKCGFNQIAFESQTYDFPSLQPPDIRVSELRNAVGGLWSTSAEADALFAHLAALANQQKIRVVGIDGQLGSSSSLYAKARLAEDLARGMTPDRSQFCSQTLNRLTNWIFDEEHPKDAEFDQDLRTCASEFLTTAERRQDPGQKHLAENLAGYLDYSQESYFNDRDRLMAENLRKYSEEGKRTIVWTANVHAAKRNLGEARPLASYFSDDLRVKSIVVTAYTGSFCLYPCTTPSSVAASSADSLESIVLGQERTDQLIDLRSEFHTLSMPATLLGYSKERTEEWSSLFDYVVVLPEEHPATHVRPPKPEQ